MQISASINTALLEASRADLFVCCLACFYAAAAELSGCDGAYVALKPKLFTTWPFTETVYPPAPPPTPCSLIPTPSHIPVLPLSPVCFPLHLPTVPHMVTEGQKDGGCVE